MSRVQIIQKDTGEWDIQSAGIRVDTFSTLRDAQLECVAHNWTATTVKLNRIWHAAQDRLAAHERLHPKLIS